MQRKRCPSRANAHTLRGTVTRRPRTRSWSTTTVALLSLVLLTGVLVSVAIWLPTDSEARRARPAGEGDDTSSEPSAGEPAPDDPPGATDDATPSAGGDGQDADADSGAHEAPDADAGELSDGEHFGFVSDVTEDAVTFEPAEFLTGDEALEAAREDGAIGPEDELPNDFHVRYQDTAPLALPLAADFEASLLDNSDLGETRTLDAASMESLYRGELDAPWMYGPRERLPVVLRVEGGEIVRAEQHYLP